MNVSMPIAAVMLDLGFPAATAKAVPMLARTAGLLAHLAEEQEEPVGFLMARKAEEAIAYERAGGGRGLMLEPDVESRPWAEQQRLDDAAYRGQLAYLFERSRVLPREARRGRVRVGRRGGRAGGHRAAAADREARAEGDDHGRQPGRRAPLRRAGGDRPHLLHERHDRHAELHPADRRRPRQLGDGVGAQLRRVGRGGRASASSRPTTPGRSWPARRWRRSTASASATSRSAPATPSGWCKAIELLRPRGGGADAVVRGVPDRVGGRARLRPRRRRASSACSWPASPAAASRPSARSSRRAGARA